MISNKGVLSESLVNLNGVPKAKDISFKGDLSLRETIVSRNKNKSIFDYCDQELLIQNLFYLITQTGVHHFYLGYNDSKIRTWTVFNPFSYEVHLGENILDKKYLEKHFPKLPYNIKEKTISQFYDFIDNSILNGYIPDEWKEIINNKNKNFSFPKEDVILNTLKLLKRLRSVENYHLRNYCINLSQHMIRLTFNCDGSVLRNLNDFEDFVESIS